MITNLTFHSSSNFQYQIASAQSIQKSKLCLTSLMSMNSALSLSFQNIIFIEQKDQTLFPGFIYICHHLFTICTICKTKFHGKLISHKFDFHHKIKFYIIYFFREESMPLGSPHLRLLLTGMLQEVLL